MKPLEGLIWNEQSIMSKIPDEVIYFTSAGKIGYVENSRIKELPMRTQMRTWDHLAVYDGKLIAVETNIGENNKWSRFFDVAKQEPLWHMYKPKPTAPLGTPEKLYVATSEAIRIYEQDSIATSPRNGITSLGFHEGRAICLKENSIHYLDNWDPLITSNKFSLEQIASFKGVVYASTIVGSFASIQNEEMELIASDQKDWILRFISGSNTLYDIAATIDNIVLRKTFTGEILAKFGKDKEITSAVAVPGELHIKLLEEVSNQ